MQAVTEIRYLDTAGVVQVLDPAVYTVTGIGDVARISLAQGQSWPATRWHDEAVTVDFIAGFGDSWNDTPEPIRAAIGEAVRSMFDGCGPVVPRSSCSVQLVIAWCQCDGARSTNFPTSRPGPRGRPRARRGKIEIEQQERAVRAARNVPPSHAVPLRRARSGGLDYH